MTRTLLGLAILLGGVSAFADPCTIATKGESPVAKACKAGGREQAEDAMRSLVKAAKAKGVVYKCTACHEDVDNYKLKSNADADFKKLLAAAQQK
jgi:hypothetical protein